MNIFYKLSLCVLILFSMNSQAQTAISREFRGVWIATVHNIDWPKNPEESAGQHKKSLIELLDLYKDMNLNAVIFQIRPAADAFYPSEIEPWSEWLTGEQGKAPEPYFDPLKFAIEETHKRGMEFHAWLNPYRASSKSGKDGKHPKHVIKKHPEWILEYGENLYLDPGLPEVRAYTNEVVKDIVSRYDVDAIHFDDYFYPYKIDGKKFPDDASFKKFGGDFFPENRDDWRRQNVNTIIKELRSSIKSTKPWVQFGISPFGVWRNADVDPLGSKTAASQTNYDDLYADIRLWVKDSIIDYVVPQAYWHIGFNIADYTEITKWWNNNSFGTHLYIGHSSSRLNSNRAPEWKASPKTEIEKQLEFNTSLSNVEGSVFFNGTSFQKNPLNIVSKLKKSFYKYPVLPPVVYPEIKTKPKRLLNFTVNKVATNFYRVHWQSQKDIPENKAVKFLIYAFDKSEKVDVSRKEKLFLITGEHSFGVPSSLFTAKKWVVLAVNRNNRLSSPTVLNN